jgi:hypothetical protein
VFGPVRRRASCSCSYQRYFVNSSKARSVSSRGDADQTGAACFPCAAIEEGHGRWASHGEITHQVLIVPVERRQVALDELEATEPDDDAGIQEDVASDRLADDAPAGLEVMNFGRPSAVPTACLSSVGLPAGRP